MKKPVALWEKTEYLSGEDGITIILFQPSYVTFLLVRKYCINYFYKIVFLYVINLIFYVFAVSSVSNPVISELSSCGSSCESLSESQLVEVLHYAMTRLFKGISAPVVQPLTLNSEQNSNNVEDNSTSEVPTLSPLPVCSLQLYYRVGRAPSPHMIQEAIASLDGFNIAATVIPVCQLNHPNTFLSLCAVRHE
jgi:hypothetical protein